MNRLLFGTAGIPITTNNPSTVNGIKRVKELGLSCMELEFVRNINISKEKAPEVKETAKREDVVLTCHAPYYINLNSEDKNKIEASKRFILSSARISYLCGAWSVCFHPGFYMKVQQEIAYNNVKKELKEIVKTLKDEGIQIWVRPELTGKGTQFGDLNEVLNLSSEVEMVMPCIDFAHIHARFYKRYNTFEEFSYVLEQVEKKLGNDGLKSMHIHLSGIEYSVKGERNHLNLKQSDMNYKDLVKAWKTFKIRGVVISESPNIEMDALLLKKTYTGAK